MTRIFFAVIFFLGTSLLLHAQDQFEWGMAEKKLAPSEEQVSLALAGYGVPSEGRFSITWERIKAVPAAIAASSQEGRLYLINHEGDFFEGDASREGGFTRLTKRTKGVTGITSAQGIIYLLTKDEIAKVLLRKGRLKAQGKISLHKTGIYKIVAHQGRLYGIGNEDAWYEFEKNGDWKKLGEAGKVRSITSVDKYVYLLKENGTMWYGHPGKPDSWKQNGRANNYTWKQPLHVIVGQHKALFALSESGELLKAVHASDSSLSVSSLVIRKNGKTVALIGVDVCGLQYAFTQSLKDSLKHRFGIAPEAVLINASHTHFAPVTQEWKAWAHFYHTPDSSYLYGVVQNAIIASVEKAIQQLSTGHLNFVRGTTAIGANRRPEANPQMPYDHSLDILTLSTTRDELKGLLFLTGCHPVISNEQEGFYTISANYPGVARMILKERLGVDNALFLQGCGGDINPVKSDFRGTGADLAEDLQQALRQRPTSFAGEISWRFDSVLVPVKLWSREKILAFREHNQQMGANIFAEKNVRWADIMLEQLRTGTAPPYMPVYVQTISIGNWLLVGLSREVVTEYGINIKEQWPDRLVSVAGYCNDVSSYLPAGWHIRTKVYEGYDSSFWYAQPDLFPENIFELVIKKVRSVVLSIPE